MVAVQSLLDNTIKSEEIYKVLEVGVGRGDFIKILFDCFHKNTHYTGVDINEEYIGTVSELYKEKNAVFLKMNADTLAFEDNYFDAVFISNTLHHLPEVNTVLQEMKRVVKDEGFVVIHEMIKDDQSEKQHSHVWLHHFSADIDNEIGMYHGHTFSRNDIKQILCDQDLKIISEMEYQLKNEHSFGNEQEMLDSTIKVLKSRINKIENTKKRESFKHILSENEEKLYETGIELATEYMAITGLK